MKKVIAVASGKGGVGKSTICCHLAKSFALKNKKTIIIETDAGLRGLDIFLNVKEIIYDLSDVLNKNCSIEDAIQKTPNFDNLYLLPAPFNFDFVLKDEDILNVCENLKKEFDYIIIDLKAGFKIAMEVKKTADIFLVVVTPDPVCVRDACFFSDFLEKDATKNFKVKLIINKIKKNFKKNSPFKTLDDIIDETKLQLIAAIPFSKDIEILTQNGNNLKKNSLPDKIFNAIAERLDEKNVKLLIC